LRRIDKLIGSGGWLARADAFSPSDWFADHAIDERGRRLLMPQRFEYYRDEDDLFPLLANLARAYPAAAAHAGVRFLRSH
jgi:uncharacterized protein (TIGR01319 family)